MSGGSGGTTGRVLVAMSGGVDSSLAAALLAERGYDVVGATVKTFCYSEVPGSAKSCCGLEGIADARSVAHTLGVPHYVFDLEEEFTRDVIDDFVAEYANGRTPNPCVQCNSYTKFNDLLRRARMLGCERIATGHYGRVDRSGGRPRLLRARDRTKDQTYFLWGIAPDVLDILELPLGELTKSEVRERARALGLVTADKPESFDICFVPDGDYAGFLRTRLEDDHPAFQPGPVVTSGGERVGTHDGYSSFTIGQRRGLPGGFSEPMYVIEVRPSDRSVVIGTAEEIYSSRVSVGELNWLGPAPAAGDRLSVQIRHRGSEAAGRVAEIEDGRLELELSSPHRAVTPGQSAALYRDDELVGGGVLSANGDR